LQNHRQRAEGYRNGRGNHKAWELALIFDDMADELERLTAENKNLESEVIKAYRLASQRLAENVRLRAAIEYFITHEVGDSYLEAVLTAVAEEKTND